MIVVVDYGEGNVRSVQKAFEYLGQPTIISQDPEDISRASHLVVPGQGAFKQAMTSLDALSLIDPIRQAIQNNVPFLGICLGFQILFEGSDEHGDQQGLGYFEGTCTRLSTQTLSVPHMGWNTVERPQQMTMFRDIAPEDYVYFVHSYAIKSSSSQAQIATCDYDETFVAAIQKGNLWGTQFHPEKSGDVGLRLLTNFCR